MMKFINPTPFGIFICFIFLSVISCQDRHPVQELTKADSFADTSKVTITRSNQGFQLMRHGKPYFIKGASGTENLRLVHDAGGNSIRTYTADGLDTLLDQAHALDLSVMVGIYVGRKIEGFNYDDAAAVYEQKERIRKTIQRYKDHPAVLCWIIGNEPDNMTSDSRHLWPALNDLVKMVYTIDPNHPVSISVYTNSVKQIAKACPDVDFFAVNIYGELPEFAKNFSYDKPYIFTEWGGIGSWEGRKTYWDAVLESSVKDKYQQLSNDYNKFILSDSLRCLGSYVFYWGQKQEYTPTWYSFFLENGAKTPLVDQMSMLWSNRMPTNRAPFLDSLLIDGKGADKDMELQTDQIYMASVRASDPEQDSLQFEWKILPEGSIIEYQQDKGYVELRPKPIPNLIIKNHGNKLIFKTPSKAQALRIMVTAHDLKGGGSYANMPFYVINNNLTK